MRARDTLSFLAALSLAGTVFAQAQTAPDPGGAQAQSAPSQNAPSQSQNAPSQNAQSQGSAANGQSAARPTEGAAGPAAASSPHQRSVTSAKTPEAAPNENPNPTGAASPHQRHSTRLAEAGSAVSSGMMVEDSSGQSVGTVSDVMRSKSGRRGYVVVSGTSGSATPIPYGVARSMAKEGKIVVDRSVFENAPKVQQSELSGSDTAWHKEVNSYWRKHRMSGKHGH